MTPTLPPIDCGAAGCGPAATPAPTQAAVAAVQHVTDPSGYLALPPTDHAGLFLLAAVILILALVYLAGLPAGAADPPTGVCRSAIITAGWRLDTAVPSGVTCVP